MMNQFQFRKYLYVTVACLFVVKFCHILQQMAKSKRESYENDKIEKQILADTLSNQVQSEISRIQKHADCSSRNIYCGHQDFCGFGCQMHHRIACLMLSYVLKLPLIHEQYFAWPYRKLWNETFYPIGSSCPSGNKTLYVIWRYGQKVKIKNGTHIPKAEMSSFPLSKGIQVPKLLGDMVENIHPNPFLWWVGQFMKFGLRLLPSEIRMVKEAQNVIRFSHPIVGFQVRRTDKIVEAKDSHHEIEEYFVLAEEYYRNLTARGVEFTTKRVFIASDDQTVLKEAQMKFPTPEWDVIGYHHGRTLPNQFSRIESLDQVIQDLFTLVKCDFIVCGLSSNLCRLLLEMLNYHHLDAVDRLRTLDGTYSYILFANNISPRILKV